MQKSVELGNYIIDKVPVIESRAKSWRVCLAVAILGLVALACANTPTGAAEGENKQELKIPQILIDSAVQIEAHPLSGEVECSGVVTGQIANALEVLTIEHCEPHIMGSNWVDPDGKRSEGVMLKHDGSDEVIQTEPVFCEVIDRELNEDNPTLCYLKAIGNYPAWLGVLPDTNFGSENPVQVGEQVITLSYPGGGFKPKMEIETSTVQWIGEITLPYTEIKQEEVCTEKHDYNGQSGGIVYRLSTGEAVAVTNSVCDNPEIKLWNFRGSRALPPKGELENWRNNSRAKYIQEYALIK